MGAIFGSPAVKLSNEVIVAFELAVEGHRLPGIEPVPALRHREALEPGELQEVRRDAPPALGAAHPLLGSQLAAHAGS